MTDLETINQPGVDIPLSAAHPKRRTSMRNLFTAMLQLFPSSSSSSLDVAGLKGEPQQGLKDGTISPSKRTSMSRLSQRLSFYRRRSVEKDGGSTRTNLTVNSDDMSVSHQENTPTGYGAALVTFQEDTESNSTEPLPKRTSQMVKKRMSSRRFLGLSRDKSQKFEITEDMINLQRIICDKSSRQRLIELLVPLDGDSSVKVRFCCAVEEYQREKEKKVKTRKGAQIVKMFVKKGSLFRLKGIPQEQETSLKAKKYECLEDLKNIFLDELGHNAIVSRIMQEILTSEANNSVPN